MSTTSGDTNLVNTEDNTKVIETLPTLAGGYTDSTFIVNKWGYKKNRNTDNYNSFPATQTLLENDERTNQDIANLRFGTKIDYLQESGTYATNIEFNLVANPLIYYMQDLNPALCTSTPMTVVDKRDGNTYLIKKLSDGKCWMVSNLLFTGASDDPANTMTLNSTTSNVASSYTESNPRTIKYAEQTTSSTYTAARLHSGTTPEGYPTIWYNFCAATAGWVCSSDTSVTPSYDICPAGWRIPSRTEFGNVTSDKASFAVTGGYYDPTLKDTNIGRWWSNTKQSNNSRWTPCYNSTSDTFTTTCALANSYAGYVRCVLK